ncbi:hypothetical protein DKT68_07070 [Micromonospora acroterricola]|uniref:Uncharacterized protein n=1 Tax=Micromonospora acroterricola TaxID=2202421 RepID=A0A317DAC0_9ACTN|nr:hypothetical protein [Micromonospora acroterricola]PWR11030.1 hypothetical protein DKT68_07070 [Micromonospora acroterricola]
MRTLFRAALRRSSRLAKGRLLATGAALVLLLLPLSPGTASAVEPSVPYWVVPGEPGTESDLTLAGVADRVLGEARRAPELFELNKGRTQPDGLALTDPGQPIMAGWVFILPEGAVSGEIRIGTPPTVTPTGGQQPAGQQPGAPPGGGQPQPAAPGTAQPAAQVDDGETLILGLRPVTAALLIVGALLVLAVVVLVPILLGQRRRTAGSARPAPAPGSRAVLDRALRQLATQAGQAQVYAALLGPDRVSLRLAPALPEAPPPWQARQQGAIWEAPSWQLDQNPDDTAGLPLLATVGTVGGELAVVNLGRAPGIVALTGDPAASMRVAGAFLDEIGRHPAAASVTISLVGTASPPWSVPERVRVVTDARNVLVPAGNGAAHQSETLRDHLVVVTTPIPPAELERLGALAAVSDGTAAVLVVGDAPNAAWRFEADADGSLDVGVLGLRLDRPTPRGRLVPGRG